MEKTKAVKLQYLHVMPVTLQSINIILPQVQQSIATIEVLSKTTSQPPKFAVRIEKMYNAVFALGKARLGQDGEKEEVESIRLKGRMS